MKRNLGLAGIAALLLSSLVTLTCAERPKSKTAADVKPAAAKSRRFEAMARPARAGSGASTLLPMAAPQRGAVGEAAALSSDPVFSGPVAFGESPEARTLPPAVAKPEGDDDPIKERGDPREIRDTETAGDGLADPVVQDSAPELATPAPTLTFEGISNQDNFNAFGFRVVPPDTDGDVGPNHYVQMVNLLVRVFDKAGAPLTAPFKLSSLWSAVGGECAAEDAGDPIVLYDPLADRWLLSQFAFANIGAPPYHQCIAISKTANPAGSYFLYDFVTPGAEFPDYPKLGVWPDAYYMTVNQFTNGGPFNGTGAYAFDRTKMLAGDPTATFIYFNLNLASHPEGIGGALPSDLDGLTPPPPGSPNVFSYFIATEFGDASDGLRLFDFHADFASPASSSFTERPGSPLAVAAFNPLSPAGLGDIEQPPPATTAMAMDSISDRLMHRLAYRNFGTHESLVTNHTVNVGTGTTLATHQAGVRYYELRRSSPGGPFTVNEQATFAPDTHNRWMGSAAQDNDGNLAVGYSISSTSVFPGIRYAARLAGDPPNGLFQGENTLINGSGVQRGTGNFRRWGDYSAMNVDPADDCTFWYTQEYYTAASQATSTVGWVTRIGKFAFTECTPAEKGTIQGVVTNSATGFPIEGALVQASGGYSRHTDAAGFYSMTVPPGTYTMTASKFGFSTATASGVVVTNGGTTIQNFALTPIPVIVPAGSTLVSESCNPATGAIDPGERVTVALSLRNIGSINTTNLVGTLQATGGVTAPSGPQSYGVVVAGGAAVTRNFTFTASSALPCGGTLTATLALQDGAANLGTASFPFTLGALGSPVTNVYSSGNIAVPILDFTTSEVPISVADSGVISDVNVRVRLNHTFDGDLTISLVHPDGTVIPLSAGRGGAGDNFGTGLNDCTGTPTVFDDSAGTPISGGVAPFAGSFRPEQPLSGLNGKPSNGTWKLRVADDFGLDEGTIGCVTLEITRQQRLCCPFTGGTPVIAAVPPATIAAETCGMGNGAVDPGELVTVNFPLRNVGSRPTTNLVATLLAAGGVTGPSAPQSYGVLSPVGPPVSRAFSFVANGPCGGTINPMLQLQDGATNLGTVSFTMTLGTSVSTPFGPFSNPGSITINDSPRVSGVALATPYPSNISVSGVTGTVTKVTATLTNLSHTFPSDIDILLVGPGGQKMILMSDAGGGTAITNRTVTFDDSAAATVPTPIVNGTFRPTNIGTGDVFPAPAPAGPYAAALSAFNGVNPNGTWSLYVVDDAGIDSGSIAGGWSLNITSSVAVCDVCFYLRENGGVLFLDGGPTGTATKSARSGGSFGGGNPFNSFGTWTAMPPFVGTLNAAGPWRGWIQLTNSDAQGFRPDIQVELHKNGVLFGSGLLRCIQGVSRGTDKEIMVPFGPFPSQTFGAGDNLALRVLARVGTNPDGSKCPGHNSGGLFMNYDSKSRPSNFEGNP